jgi:acetyl-CoA/propionyl-CoA carboxylase carboxyl transferase subunit
MTTTKPGVGQKNMSVLTDELDEKLASAYDHAPPDKVKKRHEKNQLTARERIYELLDKDSFHEIDALMVHRCVDFQMDKKKLPGDGVITGWGTIHGRKVFVFSQDFMDFGGALGEVFAKKMIKVMQLAMSARCPMIGINDSGGARIQEGVMSLGGYGEIFRLNTIASGYIPQISAIMGPCAGGAVYSPAITDFIFMVRETSHMFITGPAVIKTVTGEEISFNDLGGARTHGAKSGVCHFEAVDEKACVGDIRKLLTYLPQNCEERPGRSDYNPSQPLKVEELLSTVPDHHMAVYDMRKIMKLVMDEGSWLEVHKNFAKNFITGFARLAGRPVGVLGNNPMNLAGCLDINASDKAARFVRFCDSFNIPMVTFVDVPGFLPGSQQEHGGIIRHGAKLLFAYSEATVPMATVIVRKAYGGAYDAMCSKHIGCDVNLAWPTAEIAVIGAEGAANIIFRREIESAEDPAAKRKELVKGYVKQFSNPYKAAELGFIDAVIHPEETRPRLIDAIETMESKKISWPLKKHANIPL